MNIERIIMMFMSFIALGLMVYFDVDIRLTMMVATGCLSAINFYFGSSAGSKEKTKILSERP